MLLTIFAWLIVAIFSALIIGIISEVVFKDSSLSELITGLCFLVIFISAIAVICLPAIWAVAHLMGVPL